MANKRYDDGDAVSTDVDSDNKIWDFFVEHRLIGLILGIILIILLFILLIRGCSNKNTTLKNVEMDIDDILYVGSSTKFNVNALGSGNLKKTEYIFELSDNSIASLNSDTLKGKSVSNVIKPLSSGELEMKVSANNGDIEKSVKENILICKKFNNSAIVLKTFKVSEGDEVKLIDNIDVGIDKCRTDLTFKSSNSSILEINENGEGTAKKTGKVAVTVSNDKSSVKFSVLVLEVNKNVESVSLDKTSLNMEKGDTETLTATITPSDATIKDVKWESSNEGIVTVDEGKIKATGIGEATITVTTVDGNHSASAKVVVYSKTGISKPTKSLCKTVTYNGNSQQITKVTSKNGFVLSNYEQVNAGTYTITAKLTSGYRWKDDSTDDVTFDCVVNKAKATIKVIVEGSNIVGSSLTSNVTTNSDGNITYQWWSKTGSKKTNIDGATSSSINLISDYYGKYIGVDVIVNESNNYKQISSSDVTDKANNGNATVLRSDTNSTSEVKTTYNAPTAPTITASDGLSSGATHTNNVSLSFSGSTLDGEGSIVYYYGTTYGNLTNKGTSTGTISDNGTITYYAKACNSKDTSKCSDEVGYTLIINKSSGSSNEIQSTPSPSTSTVTSTPTTSTPTTSTPTTSNTKKTLSCSLYVSSGKVYLRRYNHESSYGMYFGSSSPQYNKQTSLSISLPGTYYGYVKDSDGNTGSCSIVIKKPTCNIYPSGNYAVMARGTDTSTYTNSTSYGMLFNNSTPNYNSKEKLAFGGSGTYYGFVKNSSTGLTNTCSYYYNSGTSGTTTSPSNPTCTLAVSSKGVTMNVSSNATSYGMFVNDSTPNYNKQKTLSLRAGTFYGFVKDSSGKTGSCSVTITNASKAYKYTDKICNKTVSSYTCYKSASTTCPSGYSKCQGPYNCQCYKAFKSTQTNCKNKKGTYYNGYCYWYANYSYTCSTGKVNGKYCYTYKQSSCSNGWSISSTNYSYNWSSRTITNASSCPNSSAHTCSSSTVGKIKRTSDCTITYKCSSGSLITGTKYCK